MLFKLQSSLSTTVILGTEETGPFREMTAIRRGRRGGRSGEEVGGGGKEWRAGGRRGKEGEAVEG